MRRIQAGLAGVAKQRHRVVFIGVLVQFRQFFFVQRNFRAGRCQGNEGKKVNVGYGVSNLIYTMLMNVNDVKPASVG